ncbi:hypothetical protein GGR58DRAFT_312103 [Xylaria digitata]|nr:hypothetical protein GGR58DRAFT_312103 [Xylaria digitata]
MYQYVDKAERNRCLHCWHKSSLCGFTLIHLMSESPRGSAYCAASSQNYRRHIDAMCYDIIGVAAIVCALPSASSTLCYDWMTG